jgi:hypothetical protein
MALITMAVQAAVSLGLEVPQTPMTRNNGLGGIDFARVILKLWGRTAAPALERLVAVTPRVTTRAAATAFAT